MNFNFTKLTDIGNYRKSNQDNLDFVINKQGYALAIVCDGMGGHSFGDIASKIAVESFVKKFEKQNFKKVTDVEIWIRNTINDILNEMILLCKKNQEALDMGTTLTALLFVENKMYSINVGDSRIYKLKDNELEQITVDQNLRNSTDDEQKERVMRTKLYAKMTEHTFWKVLTSALGPKKTLKVDINEYDDYKGTYILTTDGVHDYFDDDNVVYWLNDSKMKLRKKAALIIEDAKENMSTDNLSILIVEVD